MSQYKTVFVVSYPQSNSILTQHILNSIPGYRIYGENDNILYDYYKIYKHMIEIIEKNKARHINNKSHWFGIDNIKPWKITKESLNTFYHNYFNPTKKIKTVGFREIRYFSKNINFEEYLEFLNDFFPKSCFVFHMDSMMNVNKNSFLGRMNATDLEKYLARAHCLMYRYNKKHDRNTIIIDYRNYLENPIDGLYDLFDFLNEPLHVKSILEIVEVYKNEKKI